jgi:hypothetical protein
VLLIAVVETLSTCGDSIRGADAMGLRVLIDSASIAIRWFRVRFRDAQHDGRQMCRLP